MRKIVWVDGWQMQCCGDPMQVDGFVSWKLSPKIDSDFLANVVGPEVLKTLTDAYEHHSEVPDETTLTAGRVTAIGAVFCNYAPQPTGVENRLYPEAGTGVIESRTAADGWEPESGATRFVGYVVEVEVGGSAK